MRHHPEIQPRFLAFMLFDGQQEITQERAWEMIADEKRSADFFAFIAEMKRQAAKAGRGVSWKTLAGTKYTQITNHDEFTHFIFDVVEAN